MRSLVAIPASLVFLTFAEARLNAVPQRRGLPVPYDFRLFLPLPYADVVVTAPATIDVRDEFRVGTASDFVPVWRHQRHPGWTNKTTNPSPTGVSPLLFAQQRARQQADRGGDSKW